MTATLNPLITAGADPELRFLSPADRIERLGLAHPGLAPLLDPSRNPTRLICMIFPVKEDEPAEQPEREGEEPAEPANPDPSPDTRH